jgi:serine/threonine protein kinase
VIGEVLGNRYKVLRELGAGGMAWVYLAKDLVENTQVAVKVLYPQFNQDASYVQRFVREAKLALQVSSEHIVRILNYGSDRDVHYLVMENIQGKDLAVILRERGPLPWRESLQITAQVALALDVANAHGIVHRDIKPQNVMITHTGTVKVLDFGVARARALPSLTQTGFVGSPYYISPEQAMGEEVDVRSDIYSLGIALYEMLSGGLPFDASSPWSIISQHIAQEPPTLGLPEDEFPPAVEALVSKMLAKDPSDRYQTPGELLAGIEATLRGRVEPGRALFEQARQAQQSGSHSAAHRLLLSSLYERGREAEDAEEWSQAVNLYNRIIKIDLRYKDAQERLMNSGLQARLSTLYAASRSAMEAGRWQEAIDELSEIVSVKADYHDAAHLLMQAGRSLAEIKTRERVASLYQKGLAHYQNKEWQEADACFSQVFEVDPSYKDIARISSDARRRARWSSSILGRMGHVLTSWVNNPEEAKQVNPYIRPSPTETAERGE